MSLKHLAQNMAAHGRNGDSMLVHMTPSEVNHLQNKLQSHGRDLTINPHTGLPEAWFGSDIGGDLWDAGKDLTSSIGDAVNDVTASPLGSLLVGGALAAMGVPPNLSPYIVGGSAAVASGDLKRGLSAGLAASGGASGAAGLGVGEAGTVADYSFGSAAADVGSAGAGAGAGASTSSGLGSLPSSVNSADAAFSQNAALTADQAVAAAAPQTYTQMAPVDYSISSGSQAANQGIRMGANTSNAFNTTTSPSAWESLKGYGKDAADWASANTGKAMLGSAALGAMMGSEGADQKGVDAPPTKPGYIRNYKYDPRTGGLVALKPIQAPGYAYGGSTGETPPTSKDIYAQLRNGSSNNSTSQQVLNALQGRGAMPLFPTGQPDVSIQPYTPPSTDTPAGSPTTNGFYFQKPDGSMGYQAPPAVESTPLVVVEPPAVESTPINVDAGANGGLMRSHFAAGGIGSLGGYSDGGRLLKGPGDGVSDSIPATIGQGRQPARLADGEFVVPARIVSELGNGSTDAGARQLYKMMDRIQAGRSKTTGKNKVAANTKSAKHLPA